MTTIKDDTKMREAIIGTTQVVYSLKEQGHNVLGSDSLTPRIIGGVKGEEKKQYLKIPFIKGTKRVSVIYFD